jgi:hypothetical protein
MYKPRFPVYIISKGRYQRRPTSRVFEEIGIDYKIIVEHNEYDNYCKYIDKNKVLVLPEKYKKEYDTFWTDDGDDRSGAGAPRNYAWDHSIEKLALGI